MKKPFALLFALFLVIPSAKHALAAGAAVQTPLGTEQIIYINGIQSVGYYSGLAFGNKGVARPFYVDALDLSFLDKTGEQVVKIPGGRVTLNVQVKTKKAGLSIVEECKSSLERALYHQGLASLITGSNLNAATIPGSFAISGIFTVNGANVEVTSISQCAAHNYHKDAQLIQLVPPIIVN